MTDSVLFEEIPCGRRRIGLATLNSPRKLNALDFGMIQALYAKLLAWRADPEVAVVVLRGAGERAFCAGGDIREVAEALRGHRAEEVAFAEIYFPAEYRLDYLIHTYGKPFLVWGDGIVMGGGLGLMSGGSVRVVTPRSLLAMPEITIGLFPDVGASWFLNRMPGRAGLYLGLTAARIDAADALFLGLADDLLPADAWPRLLQALTAAHWLGEFEDDQDALKRIVRALRLPAGPSKVARYLDTLNALTDDVRTPDVCAAIADHATDDPWLAENAARLAAGSPTSAFVIHEQWRRARHLSLADCFRMELDMMVQFSRRHDFPEGVRALLVDKDNKPQWQPARLEDVTHAWVAAHFASPWHGRENPLADLGVGG